MICTDKTIPGITVWSMTPSDACANPAGVVQGGFLAAFADSAMSASAITYARGRKVLAANTELKVSFVRSAPIGRPLTCRARVIGGGRRILFLEADIVDASDRTVAKASSTFVVDERPPPTVAEEIDQLEL